MSYFKALFVALPVAVLGVACDRQVAPVPEPSGIQIMRQDAIGETSSSSHGGFTIRSLDTGLVTTVPDGEVLAALARPSGVILRRLPPGLYSVALDGTSSEPTSRPELVVVKPARFTTVRVQSAARERAVALATRNP